MRIVTVRRISQVFFLVVFLWFCIVATLGAAWWQWRGWPINWILDLDPLTSLATVLATGTLYANLTWALAAIVLTLVVATDPVAADAVGVELLGRTLSDVPYIQMAHAAGAGIADYRRLNPVLLDSRV